VNEPWNMGRSQKSGAAACSAPLSLCTVGLQVRSPSACRQFSALIASCRSSATKNRLEATGFIMPARENSGKLRLPLATGHVSALFAL
jgi:hypothetical protein